MVGFVSHKDGSSATAIQQIWGGITQRGEPMLAAHPETLGVCSNLSSNGLEHKCLMQQQSLER